MPTLTNSPRSLLSLRLERAKSFALGIVITDHRSVPLDITGAEIRIIAKKAPFDRLDVDDGDNLITNSAAVIESPLAGYARFDLQASDLDFKAGEYDYIISMLHEGYQTVLARGPLELQDNPGSSIDGTYSGEPVSSLQVALQAKQVVQIQTGPAHAPGSATYTLAEQEKLSGIQPGAEVNVNANWLATDGDAVIANKPSTLLPPGGVGGEVLTKLSVNDQDATWSVPDGTSSAFIEDPDDPGYYIPAEGDFLDATGIPAGYGPKSNGVDGWSWVPVDEGATIDDLDDVPDSATRLAMTPAERTKLGDVDLTPDWADISGKPTFGTASTHAHEDYRAAGVDIDVTTDITGVVPVVNLPRIGDLDGNDYGTGVPTGGSDGDEYFQYTP